MSLSPGDALQFPNGVRIVEGAWSTGVIVTVPHNDAVGADTWRPSASTIVKDNIRKVSIDPIGRIRPAND